MVSIGYLIDNPGPPSALARFVNERVVPPAIDAAGAVESTVYEFGEQVRARPTSSLLAAGALGFLIGATIFCRPPPLARRRQSSPRASPFGLPAHIH